MSTAWYKHLDELKEYKTQNEHVSVPRKSGSLGEWCRTQRRYYKQYQKGEKVPLTKERMEALEDLGFIWLPAELPRRKRKLKSTVLEGIRVGGVETSIAVGTHNSPTPENTHEYRPPGLEKVHNTYDESLSSPHRANERLCDERLAIARMAGVMERINDAKNTPFPFVVQVVNGEDETSVKDVKVGMGESTHDDYLWAILKVASNHPRINDQEECRIFKVEMKDKNFCTYDVDEAKSMKIQSVYESSGKKQGEIMKIVSTKKEITDEEGVTLE
jgi:hypothetical protein